MTTDRYAVFGKPVAHSLSPDIHTAFAKQTGQVLRYDKQEILPGTFADQARAFFASGGKGLNVTLPYKTEAFTFANTLTERARRAGAVNTLALKADNGASIIGDNTDGAGLVRDLCNNLCWPVSGQRLLILGAGGAVHGVLEPLLKQNPALIVIANRTVSKAQALAEDFSDLGNLRGIGFDKLENFSPFNLVINGSSASLAGELPPLPDNLVTPDSHAYDMMYSAEPTVFMAWMTARQVKNIANGLGMLVEQAAESFYIWRGIRPKTKSVFDSLRKALSKPDSRST